MVVIGAGVIGLELGSVWQRLGSDVTFIEAMDKIAPGSDFLVSKTLKRLLERQHLKFMMETKVMQVNTDGGDVIVTAQPKQGPPAKVPADVVMVAVGRRPYTKGLGLKEVGVETDKGGRIVVDDNFQTSVKSIYAIGDVIRGPMLAHKASEEGFAVVEKLAGMKGVHVNYEAIPSVVYTSPEVAWVGATEESARATGVPFRSAVFPMKACSRARCMEETDGFVKVIAHAETDKVIGVHIIAPAAGELIGEATAAVEMGITSAQLARICHAHPTLSEALKEASLGVLGKPLHV
eukprot:TRINITY_DN584_c0_g1_i2.p1 TRINITY_DN584_c0_g1~~TRINITY_DN584_c0_g1_i2.p1  ORF type:complete len:292 (+),score=63.73 TRINITY_DN584_c0_g1_i2:229-1104(+)